MERTLKILKLGGSVITDKKRLFTASDEEIRRLAKEIAKAAAGPLIIVHGGGSFGHPIAKEYDIASGFTRAGQLTGFVRAREAMMGLNTLVVDALVSQGFDALAVQPSAFIMTQNGRIAQYDTVILKTMLKMGFTPVLHGDAVLDSVKGFTILSGDQIAARLAIDFGANRIILGTDVDGIYTADPKVSKASKLIPQLNLRALQSLLSSAGVESESFADVTGLMPGKLVEVTHAIKKGVDVLLINALKEDRVLKALRGEKIPGTLLTR